MAGVVAIVIIGVAAAAVVCAIALSGTISRGQDE
jgi:hypothetical protein